MVMPRSQTSVMPQAVQAAGRRGQPPSEPLVDGISPAAFGSIATAVRSARARPLEAGLGDMMAVIAIEGLDVQSHAGIHGEGLEPLAHQLGVELTDLVAAETRP